MSNEIRFFFKVSIDLNHKKVTVECIRDGDGGWVPACNELRSEQGDIASVGSTLIMLGWERKERGDEGLKGSLFFK